MFCYQTHLSVIFRIVLHYRLLYCGIGNEFTFAKLYEYVTVAFNCISSIKGIFSDSNNIFFMTWIRRYKQKKLKSKISVGSNFTFSSYAWLCVFHCSHRLLCYINSRVRDFLWKLLSFHTKMISALYLWWSVLLRGELRKYAKNSNFENFESALYSTSGSMPLTLAVFYQFCYKILKCSLKKVQMLLQVAFSMCGF